MAHEYGPAAWAEEPHSTPPDDEQLSERRKAFDDLYNAACDARYIDADATPILDGAAMARLAYRLHVAAKSGALPLPAEGHLRRCWEYLVPLDPEARAIDEGAIADVYAEDEAVPFVGGEP